MTIVNTVDKRNTEWRDNNIGSKLLGKMGWKEGSGIGLRNKNVTALRAVKRQVGLGIGAKRQSEAGPSESTGTFAAVLANLQSHHGGKSDGDDDEKKKKKKSKKDKKKKKKNQSKKGGLMLPQNKVLAGHSRKMREAKFGTKSQHDLACIFGNTDVVATAVGSFTPIAAPIQATTTTVLPSVAAVSSKKRSRNDDEDDEDDDDDDDDSPSSSSDADDADDNEKLLVTKKEEKEQKRAAKKQRKEEKKKQKKSSTLDDKKKKSKKSSKKI